MIVVTTKRQPEAICDVPLLKAWISSFAKVNSLFVKKENVEFAFYYIYAA
jgi:hypothetical protein